MKRLLQKKDFPMIFLMNNLYWWVYITTSDSIDTTPSLVWLPCDSQQLLHTINNEKVDHYGFSTR